jgi:hypothetical protein
LDTWVESWLLRILEAGPIAVRAQKALISKWEELGPAAAIEAGIDTFSDAYMTDEPHRMVAPHLKSKA